MTMTAPDLYKIVRDVPEAAWPKGIRYTQPIEHADGAVQNAHGTWSVPEMNTNWYFAPAPLEMIENAFVGAMVRHRVEQGVRDPHPFKSGNEYIVWNGRECHVAPTLIEALAAACKKQEDDDGN